MIENISRQFDIEVEYPTINLLNGYCKDFVFVSLYAVKHLRYNNANISTKGKGLTNRETIAIDIPVLLKSNNFNGNTIAIVGERPLRKLSEDPNKNPYISLSSTFGQDKKVYKNHPRSYDLLIDYYLSKGFNVYCTNLKKTSIFEDSHIDKLNISIKDIDLINKELSDMNICHVIWLGDSSDKRFWYAKVNKSCNIYPHLSGSANNKWKDILKGKACTDINKVDYIIDPSHTNIIRYI